MKTVEHSGQVCRVVDNTMLGMFRELDVEEACNFRAGADECPEGTIIKALWHPIYQDQLFINGKGVEEAS